MIGGIIGAAVALFMLWLLFGIAFDFLSWPFDAGRKRGQAEGWEAGRASMQRELEAQDDEDDEDEDDEEVLLYVVEGTSVDTWKGVRK